LFAGIMVGYRYAATAQFKCAVRKENTGKQKVLIISGMQGRAVPFNKFSFGYRSFTELSKAVKHRYKLLHLRYFVT